MMTEPGVLNNGEEIDYAMGLMINQYNGLNTVSHGGSFVGFNAEMMRFPDQKTTIVILANTNNFYASGFAYQVADVVLADDFQLAENETKNAVVKNDPKFLDLSEEALEKFSGDYWNEAEAYKRKIYVKDGKLMYYRNQYSESELRPISDHEFKMMNVAVDLIVRFDIRDEYQMYVTIDDGEPSKFKTFNSDDFGIEKLKEYTGDYYSQELDVMYAINFVEGELMLKVNKMGGFPLEPIIDNVLMSSNYGTFEFEEDENSVISGFRLASGRVKNLYFKKIQ